GVGLVGLVASRRRGAAVLAEMGLTETERARISSPAGFQIGARTAHEIAVSILAEIIAAIRTRGLTPAVPVPAPAGGEAAASPIIQAVDPVCGMAVTVSPDTPHLAVDGEDVWFCGPGCRERHAEKDRR
ncbi:XdhC family protein, partial [Streptosporangium amethystogenes]